MSVRSDYVYSRGYRGKVKGLVLDWSGTTADAYVLAPAVVFVEVFEKHGVPISMQEARGPMGLRKDLHIKALTELPEISARWKAAKGSAPGAAEVAAMFADFVPMQLDCLRKYTTLLPGVAEVTQRLQKDGIKIGSSTGFIRSMVDILEEDAKTQGYVPDASVAGDEVVNGARPAPHMVYRNLDLMNISPIQSVVKVDDTVSGVGEALEAGCWGVGVSRYSNYMDINTLEEADQLSQQEFDRRNALTVDILRKAGAHYVIDSLADLPEVIDDINERLARGEKP
jgi:phosphonoacetaldehyde hydrolase